MRFDAAVAGEAGNGVTLIVSSADLGSFDVNPVVSAQGQNVFIELNSNPIATTTAFDLRETINQDTTINQLLTAQITAGNAFTKIGDRAVNYSPLTLSGANTARGTVNFNRPGLEVELRSVATGSAGNGIVVNFAVNNFGGAAAPVVTVNNRVVTIVLNNSPGNESTALDLVTAINSNTAVNGLIRGNINSGDALTKVGNAIPPAPLTLLGANLASQVLYALAFWLTLLAFDVSISLMAVLWINTAAALLGGLVPVPGGVGVTETILTAGLVAAGVDEATAFAAAVTYRVLYAYLPPLWGWFAMRWLQNRGYL